MKTNERMRIYHFGHRYCYFKAYGELKPWALKFAQFLLFFAPDTTPLMKGDDYYEKEKRSN